MTPLELPTSPDDRDAWAAFLVSRCDDMLDDVRLTAEAIAQPSEEPTDDSTEGARDTAGVLHRWNSLSIALLNATTAATLVGQAHPDATIRDLAHAAEQKVATVANEVRLDRRLYDTLASLDTTGLDETAERMLRMTLRDFLRAGVDRDEPTRTRLQELAERDKTLARTFERNLNDDVRSVALRPEQLDGLPADYVAAHPADGDGRVRITTDYPDVLPFLSFAHDRDARLDVTREFLNRGWPDNDAILHEIIEIRRERARLLGYRGWPDYDAEIRMVGSEDGIRDFLDRIETALEEAVERDIAVVVARQRKDGIDSDTVSWADFPYYQQLLRHEQFDVDAEELRGYLDFAKVRAGVLDTTSRLFGLQYVERPDVATWHADATAYDVVSDAGLLGRIYLDLHPREGKFKHAAHFPLVKGVRDVQLPQSALMCNLPRGLMRHDDVVTLVHEFGHLLHALLGGHQEWGRFSGVATERDFIEAPSQMLEEWAWHADVLQGFATNTDGEPLPADLVARLRRSDEFGRGIDLSVQAYYTAISLGIHADVPDDLTTYAHTLAREHQPLVLLPDTHKHASFGHLADEGYGSSYYTYLWSLVISKDLLSAFDPDDMLAPEVARRYRDTVLAPGGSRDAADLVQAFLGRPTDTAAFDRWLAG